MKESFFKVMTSRENSNTLRSTMSNEGWFNRELADIQYGEDNMPIKIHVLLHEEALRPYSNSFNLEHLARVMMLSLQSLKICHLKLTKAVEMQLKRLKSVMLMPKESLKLRRKVSVKVHSY